MNHRKLARRQKRDDDARESDFRRRMAAAVRAEVAERASLPAEPLMCAGFREAVRREAFRVWWGDAGVEALDAAIEAADRT